MKLILFFISAIISVCILKYFPVPYIWVGLLWVILFGFFFIKTTQETPRAIYFNLAILTLLLTGAESYFWMTSTSRNTIQEGEYFSHKLFMKDDILGYAPPPNINNAQGKLVQDGTLIYDMHFSTDEKGQRKAYKIPDAKESILFFGCSFTFGIGIQDNETLPYQTGFKVSDLNTYNFAYGGYGPQQMLSALEQGLVKKVVSEKPRYVIYVALPEHINRAAGLTSWNINDPKYEKNADGEIVYAGHFNDVAPQKSLWINRLRAYANKSYLLQKIFVRFIHLQTRPLTPDDLDRYIKIVIKAKNLFEQDYQDAAFHIILWDLAEDKNTQELIEEIATQWRKNNIQVHLVSDILPDFYAGNPKYQIKGDGHPTAQANQLIANYISETVVDHNRISIRS